MSSLSEFWGPPLALLWSFSNAGHRQISMHVSLVVRCAARWERDVSYGEQARTGDLGMGVPFWTFETPVLVLIFSLSISLSSLYLYHSALLSS